MSRYYNDFSDLNDPEALKHYGVKGMKWGVHKYGDTYGKKTSYHGHDYTNQPYSLLLDEKYSMKKDKIWKGYDGSKDQSTFNKRLKKEGKLAKWYSRQEYKSGLKDRDFVRKIGGSKLARSARNSKQHADYLNYLSKESANNEAIYGPHESKKDIKAMQKYAKQLRKDGYDVKSKETIDDTQPYEFSVRKMKNTKQQRAGRDAISRLSNSILNTSSSSASSSAYSASGQQFMQQMMHTSQMVSNTGASLALSGGTNPYMFGM